MLLDTNALIILLFGEVTTASLSDSTKTELENAENLFLSEISLLEMSIKIKLGKLEIKQSVQWIADKCREYGITLIPLTIEQMDETLSLPLLADHHDPFDRLIVAVAKQNKLTLVSTDEKMRVHQNEYGITVMC